jgi:hypothetical protein
MPHPQILPVVVGAGAGAGADAGLIAYESILTMNFQHQTDIWHITHCAEFAYVLNTELITPLSRYLLSPTLFVSSKCNDDDEMARI